MDHTPKGSTFNKYSFGIAENTSPYSKVILPEDISLNFDWNHRSVSHNVRYLRVFGLLQYPDW